jgi:hypothetical protein
VIADQDRKEEATKKGRRFSEGSRPVIRWIKGDGLDDAVTRAAIGQATRLFGSDVDYCLCTQGIDAARARTVLEWASQPVEWWPVTEQDNAPLAALLKEAGCEPENFGYWWKWFPERVRPAAPEWILDGDMVVTGKPDWFKVWLDGRDGIRLSQDDAESLQIYGSYSNLVDPDLMLYSGLLSLPPNCRYMPQIIDMLATQPLPQPHHGKNDMSEQGVIAVAFQQLNAVPVPLYEFPFCRAFQNHIDYGLLGDQGRVWGYHFGNSFVMHNPHFDRLTATNIVFSLPETNLIQQFQWLGGHQQWGTPGWTMNNLCVERVLSLAAAFKGKTVLEIGTSRGKLSAMLATLGCIVTTIDHTDRGAAENLEGLGVKVLQLDARDFLEKNNHTFKLVICDLHGNTPADWKSISKALILQAQNGSTLILSNALLHTMPEWKEETGVRWFLHQLPRKWKVQHFRENLPGIVVIKAIRTVDRTGFRKTTVSWISALVVLGSRFTAFRIIVHLMVRKRLGIQLNLLQHNSYFDAQYYLKKNPDVRNSGMEPTEHFLRYGAYEGRRPSAYFDSAFYLEQNPDVCCAGMNPLVHYLRFGQAEGRAALPSAKSVSSMFPETSTRNTYL